MARYFRVEDIVTQNKLWIVPEAQNQEFEVSVWGGGGAGSTACIDPNVGIGGAGGGSGYMNYGVFKINKGERIDITIGKGGTGYPSSDVYNFTNTSIGEPGDPTFFGNYIYAAGGQGGNVATGGIGGYNGGDMGCPGAGNYGSYGITATVNNISYASGGGGSSINARGRGGSANMTQGSAGTGGGGAGCFIESVSNGGIQMRTGNGGQGVCVIKYNRAI